MMLLQQLKDKCADLITFFAHRFHRRQELEKRTPLNEQMYSFGLINL